MKKVRFVLCILVIYIFGFVTNALPQIYISSEVAKVSPYSVTGAMNTYIATQNLSGGWNTSLISGANIQTYNFGTGSDVSYN
jgi:hypothetical protein